MILKCICTKINEYNHIQYNHILKSDEGYKVELYYLSGWKFKVKELVNISIGEGEGLNMRCTYINYNEKKNIEEIILQHKISKYKYISLEVTFNKPIGEFKVGNTYKVSYEVIE